MKRTLPDRENKAGDSAPPRNRLGALMIIAAGAFILAAAQLPGWLDRCWTQAHVSTSGMRADSPARRRPADKRPRAKPPVVTNTPPANQPVGPGSNVVSNAVAPAKAATNSVPAKTNAPAPAAQAKPAPASTNAAARRPPPPKPKGKLPPAPTARKQPAATAPKTAAPPGIRAIPPDIAERLDEINQMAWSRETEAMLLAVLYRWGEMDPEAALEYSLSLEHRVTRNTAVGKILADWASKFPQSAFDWFEAMAQVSPDLMAAYTGPMFSALAVANTGRAMQSIWEMPTDGMKNTALATVAQVLFARNREDDLFAMYATLTKESDRILTGNAIIQMIGRHRPVELGEWVLGISDAEHKSRALDSLVSVWAFDDPAAAASWVSRLPAGAGRARQITRVVDNWVREDPAGAAGWLLSMSPPSPETDDAVSVLVRAVMKEEPAGAMSWAGATSDSRRRWSLAEEVARWWAAKDPAGLRDYIQHTDMPRDVRNRLRNIAGVR